RAPRCPPARAGAGIRSVSVRDLSRRARRRPSSLNDATYLRRAIQRYKAYLEQVPSGGRRSEATEAKADLEARLARDPQAQAGAAPAQVEKRKARVTVISATVGAQASLDGGPPQELPYFGDLEPGKHRVRIFADGYFDAEREVSGDKPVDQPVDVALAERPAIVTVVLDTNADILVDGRLIATAPLSRPIEVPPGAHVLSVSANGKKPLSQEVVLVRAKPFRFEPKREASGQRVVAMSMLGVGAASVVTGVVFGILSLGQEPRSRQVVCSSTRSIDRPSTCCRRAPWSLRPRRARRTSRRISAHRPCSARGSGAPR
ncbi:MAG: TonB-dependent receptor, partial [Labilithrix sp.]|nr:TonB-dependent receptor [Labilithrix sp.]